MNDGEFCKCLRALRKKAGLNQEELSNMTGVSITTVRRWEWGVRTPRIDEVKKLCAVLGCSEAELLNGPKEEEWILEIKVGETKGDVIDMSESMSCVASVNCTREGASLLLAGKWETFRDDAKFEDFVSQLRAARGLVLRNGEEMERLKGE